jgi:hypothetical protein
MDPEMDSYPNLESKMKWTLKWNHTLNLSQILGMDSLNLNPETAVKPADPGDWLGLKYSNCHLLYFYLPCIMSQHEGLTHIQGIIRKPIQLHLTCNMSHLQGLTYIQGKIRKSIKLL